MPNYCSAQSRPQRNRPQLLLGYKTQKEKLADLQIFLLEGQSQIEIQLGGARKRIEIGTMRAIRPANPDPPSPTTMWQIV